MTTLTELTARLRNLVATVETGMKCIQFGGNACIEFKAACTTQNITRLLNALAAAQVLREEMEVAVMTLQHLAINEPDCLGWVGHDEDSGPWPKIQERASRAQDAIAAYDRAAGNGGTG